MYRGLSLSSEAMEAPRILPALAWTFLIQAIFTQVALVEGHPPPPPATRGNFSTKSQRQQQHAIDNDIQSCYNVEKVFKNGSYGKILLDLSQFSTDFFLTGKGDFFHDSRF